MFKNNLKVNQKYLRPNIALESVGNSESLGQKFKAVQRVHTAKCRDFLLVSSVSKAGKSSDTPSSHVLSQIRVTIF